jgi:hypothetical protein
LQKKDEKETQDDLLQFVWFDLFFFFLFVLEIIGVCFWGMSKWHVNRLMIQNQKILQKLILLKDAEIHQKVMKYKNE